MNDTTFDKAIAYTLRCEGGYVFDPADPGGETHYGISKRNYPYLNIKELTLKEARHIYQRDYWRGVRINLIDDSAIATKVFDLGVNIGARRAIRLLQRAINSVCAGEVAPRRRSKWRRQLAAALGGKPIAVDGIIGTITCTVLRACPHKAAVLMALKAEAYQHYTAQNQPLYMAGWLTRLAGDA